MAKIMLVEDDMNLREIYAARLSAENYDVVTASDGEEALAVAVKEKPDLIVLDVMMPKISGFDVLDILRSTPETKHAKIIMMTALSQQSDRERGERLGAEKYLVKSQVTLEDVVNTVSELLGQAEQAASSVIGANVQSAPAPTNDSSLAGDQAVTNANNTKEDSMDPQNNQTDDQAAVPVNDDSQAPVQPPEPTVPADEPATPEAPVAEEVNEPGPVNEPTADTDAATTLEPASDVAGDNDPALAASVAAPVPEQSADLSAGQTDAEVAPAPEDVAAETVEPAIDATEPAPVTSDDSTTAPVSDMPAPGGETTATDEVPPAEEPGQVPMPSEPPAEPPAPVDDPTQVADPNNPEPGKVVMPENNDNNDPRDIAL